MTCKHKVEYLHPKFWSEGIFPLLADTIAQGCDSSNKEPYIIYGLDAAAAMAFKQLKI